MRLGRVLENAQAVAPGNGDDLVHRGRLSVQVDRNHDPCPLRDSRLDPIRVQRVRGGIDVDRHRPRARGADRQPRRHERVTRHDHLVAGTYAHGSQGQAQRV